MFAARQLIWGRTKQMGNTLKKKRTSARRAATFLAALGVLVMSSGVALMVATAPANAAKAADCVPAAAFTETINHPAVSHVVHHDAVASKWWNWSPNKDQAPFNGPPSFPTDPRGVWEGPHADGGPAGDGTFSTAANDNGHAPWFHRNAAVDAFDETIIDTPASVETINHPAVTCNEVSPPTAVHHTTVVNTPKAKAKAVTPTVVHAGLTSVSAKDMRGEQGLALMVAGMVMLVGAGGLRLRTARASRI
jgi:hypothetical protein